MDDEVEERIDSVVSWRQEVLECAGFDPADALVLAGCRDVDVHWAVELVRSGCPPETAARIVG